MSMQDRAKEGGVKSNMHTTQLAAEDFSTQSEGLYPQSFAITVVATNANVAGNVTTVAGVAGALVPVASTAANPVLLPGNMRNPVSRVGFAFSSGAAAVATPPAAAPAIVIPAAGAASDQGSLLYQAADNAGAAALVGNAAKYVIYGYGVKAALPNPLSSGQ
jgi:hypothetical protein